MASQSQSQSPVQNTNGSPTGPLSSSSQHHHNAFSPSSTTTVLSSPGRQSLEKDINEINTVFTIAQQEIDAQQTRCANLQNFYVILNSPETSGAFDNEDRELVLSNLRQIDAERKRSIAQLAEKQEVFKRTVQELSSILHHRKSVLDAAESQTHALSQNPSLLEKFATKQADLTRKLQELIAQQKQSFQNHSR